MKVRGTSLLELQPIGQPGMDLANPGPPGMRSKPIRDRYRDDRSA
jgi:hypothetical protein